MKAQYLYYFSVSLFICYILLESQIIYGQAPFPSHAHVLRGEAELFRTMSPKSFTMAKPMGEAVENFDVKEVRIEYGGDDRLPSNGEVSMRFTALTDQISEVSLFILGVDARELSIAFSIDGSTWEDTRVRTFINGGFSVILPRALNINEEGYLLFSTDMDWSQEPPVSATNSPEFSHLVTSSYIPFNGETFIFDQFTLTTVINREAGIHPAGLGRLISRPNDGEGGEWIYQSEIDTYLSIYAVGGGYPQSIDGRIEIFNPLTTFGATDDATTIIEAMSAVIPVYEAFYGQFPFERLGAYPISEEAGAAIGPQAQILLPWYFWLNDSFSNDFGFEPKSVIYHEIAHQYFFNTVKLHPDPELGQAWLSEAMAEFSAVRALEEIDGSSKRHRWNNFYLYLLSVDPSTELPVAGSSVNESPNYFETVYMRGSTLVYGLYHRMSNFTEKLNQCMLDWRILFIDYNDMFNCFREMTPKEGYENFDVNAYFNRYFLSTTRDLISLTGRYVDDETSEVVVSDTSWNDSLEIRACLPQGDIEMIYIPRQDEQTLTHRAAALQFDPAITTPRKLNNTVPADVDLNGVVDGQDALDVLFHTGASLSDLSTYFPIHLDVDQDQVIANLDITEIQRQLGFMNR